MGFKLHFRLERSKRKQRKLAVPVSEMRRLPACCVRYLMRNLSRLLSRDELARKTGSDRRRLPISILTRESHALNRVRDRQRSIARK